MLLLSLTLHGCQNASRTFAGFTFGGGGNTFSCEPASWTSRGAAFELTAGPTDAATSLRLTGDGPLTVGEPATLSRAEIKVPGHEGTAALVSGTLVCQSQDGTVAHGSFDLKAKTPDGREFPVVGSFTASQESQP